MSAILPPVPADAAPTPFSRWTVPCLVTVVALFDFSFWNRRDGPGLSLAFFTGALVLAVTLCRPRGQMNRRAGILALLLTGALAETVIETGFCNMLMLLGLTLTFSAETFFVRRSPGLGRWSAQVRAFALAPCRLIHLAAEVMGRWVNRAGLTGRIGAGLLIGVPTLALLLLFGTLLSSANAVFGLWAKQAFQGLWSLLPEVNCWRLGLWIFVAAAAVALIWPSEAPVWPERKRRRLERWPEMVPARLAFWASIVLLAALNLMFAVANYADLLFLWRGSVLPAGVNYSHFVHEGVNLLITTVLLSAVVLAAVFNQSVAVAGRRGLKALGGLWIVQNLFLVLSTAQRLDLYIEAYGATVSRFSTLLFLMLVAAGFGLLAAMIQRGKTLGWLMGKSVVAAFGTLYLAQFLNLGGWAADYNVARWERDRSQPLDVTYLAELGPAAWPAWTRARNEGAIQWMNDERSPWTSSPMEQERSAPHTRLDGGHWRNFSLRAWWNRDALKTDKK